MYPGRLVLEPGLHGGDLASLPRPGGAVENLKRLPATPGELVVVPHRHERPAGTRVLQIRIVQVGAIDRAIVIDRGGDMKVLDFLAVLVAHDVPQLAV